jgi:hypothetical protein
MGQFSFECCPLSQISDPGSTICPALGGWPVAPPCFLPLCFSQSLLGAGGSSGRLACHLAPALSLCCFTCILLRVWCWEFGSLTHPCSLEQVQCFTPPLLLVSDYSLLFKFFWCCCPGAVLDYFPRWSVGESCVVRDAHLLFCSFTQAPLELAGVKKLPTFFSVV